MLYKLLGMTVWNGAKWYLRRRLGPPAPPRALAVGGALALGLGAAAMLARRASRT
jgi:hypothetical protein